MLELVVLAEKVAAERTGKDAPAVIPHGPVALDAVRISQSAAARMSRQALPAVTNGRFAKVANSAGESHTGGKHGWMLDDTIARFRHAFDLAALTTHRQSLHRLTEIAEETILLLPLTLIALHCGIARPLSQISQRVLGTNFR